MQLFGFAVFLVALPLAGLGLCDPNTRRGDFLALTALAAVPGGLILAAM